MRLTCPNCAAQYEVPETAIPAAGRDVQCAACGEAWVQQPAGPAPAAGDPGPPAPEEAPQPAPQAEPAQRRLDPQVAEILRSEAARERARRAAEATGDVRTPAASSESHQGPLPDPGDITASLNPGRAADDVPRATASAAGRSGFGAGFWVALVAIGLAVGAYVAAEDLIAWIPEAESPIARYVAAVDAARLRLDALVEIAITRIRGG